MKKTKKPRANRRDIVSEDEAFRAWLKQNVLRRAFRRWPPYSKCLNAAKEGRMVGKQWRVQFRCAACARMFSRKEVCVDHIDRVGGGGQTIEAEIKAMFCPIDNLQVLCNYKLKDVAAGKYEVVSCHYKKTCEEKGHVAKTTEEVRREAEKAASRKARPRKATKKTKRRRTLGKASG